MSSSCLTRAVAACPCLTIVCTQGPLSAHLRLDLPYIPHITIGTLAERHAAKQLCDQLNRAGLGIHGSVNSLTVGTFANGKVNDPASFELRK